MTPDTNDTDRPTQAVRARVGAQQISPPRRENARAGRGVEYPTGCRRAPRPRSGVRTCCAMQPAKMGPDWPPFVSVREDDIAGRLTKELWSKCCTEWGEQTQSETFWRAKDWVRSPSLLQILFSPHVRATVRLSCACPVNRHCSCRMPMRIRETGHPRSARRPRRKLASSGCARR